MLIIFIVYLKFKFKNGKMCCYVGIIKMIVKNIGCDLSKKSRRLYVCLKVCC